MTILPQRFTAPYFIAIDDTGNPIPDALLYFYASGSTTPLDTFNDAALTIPNANPLTADGAGVFPAIFLQAADYRVVLQDSTGDEIWTADPVGGSEAANTYAPSFEFIGTGVPFGNDVLGMHSHIADVLYPSGFASSTGQVLNVPNNLYTATIYKNQDPVGNMTISINGGFGFSTLNNAVVPYANGDLMWFKGQPIADATLSNFCWTMIGRLL